MTIIKDQKILHVGNLNKIFQKFNLSAPCGAKKIIEIFKKNNSQILIPGGFVRDILLKEIPHDIDFATDLSPDEIQNLLEKELSGEYKKLELQGKTFGVIRIVMTSGENYEIATFRKDGKYSDGIHPDNVELIDNACEDAQRRDFTMNALFYNPISGNIVDYVGGLSDIENKKLKFVGNASERIEEDKSRMLRYLRFLLKTNFSSEKSDVDTIKNYAHEIKNIPREIIKKELDKIIQLTDAKTFLERLDELNLLENIFPDLKELENCGGGAPFHMEGNTFIHTLMVCENLPENSDPILKWSAIFHDIGKIETRKSKIQNNQEKVSFIGHDKIGAEKTSHILKNMKFSKFEIKKITWIIKNHLRIFMQIFDFIKNNDEKSAKKKSVKEIKKLIKQSNEKQVKRLISLACADSKSSIYENGDGETKYFNKIFDFFENAKDEIENENKKGIDIEKIVDGKIIMKELNLETGEKIGKIKKQIVTELSDKNFDNKEEAQKEFIKILKNFSAKGSLASDQNN